MLNRSLFSVFFLAFILSTPVSAQFFDFSVFDASTSRQTFPQSSYGTASVTVKSMDFGGGDTLWVGTYRDGAFKWWFQDIERGYWWGISKADGQESYNIAYLNSKYVFFTDYNSFTQEYNGLFRLRNKNVLVDYKNDAITHIGPDSTYPVMPRVNDISTLGDSLVLLATDSGLVMFDGEGRWRRRNPNNVTNISNWKIDEVTALNDGSIYLASGTDIYRRVDINWEKIDLREEPYRQRNTYVKEIRTGPNDTVWIITTKAVIKIHQDTSIVIKNEEIKDFLNEVNDVAFDSLGNPWMIFELNGGVRFVDESSGRKVWRQINSTNSDLPDEVSCIATDSSGTIWLGTDNNGIFKYSGFTPGSISNTLSEKVSIFPTVGDGLIQVQYPDYSDNLKLTVSNISGKKVLQSSFYENTQINLQTGVYLITIESDKDAFSKKVVVL